MTPRELDHMRKVYLKAEVDIINEIARLRSRGLVDYHAVAALERVQKILLSLQDEAWRYVPRMIEKYFYVNHPELYTRAPKTAKAHLLAYENAVKLTAPEIDAAQRLTFSLISDLERSSATVMAGLTELLLGRQQADVFRRAGLEASLQMRATGLPLEAKRDFVERLRREGVTAFVDRAGRHWSLHDYADMATRTIAKQASVTATLMKHDTDLYKMTSHGTTCKLCAPFEGRVFSASGESDIYPPLADAFGKIDPLGPNTLANTYLTIHPNCMHTLVPWSESGKSEAELSRIQKFSSPETNPYSVDPRSKAQIAAYQNNQRARQKMLADFKQFEDYRLAIPDKMPKTFQTFQRHKLLDDAKYKGWVEAYKKWMQ